MQAVVKLSKLCDVCSQPQLVKNITINHGKDKKRSCTSVSKKHKGKFIFDECRVDKLESIHREPVVQS